MDNRIIQSLWIGDLLSNNEILCLRSYLYHHHDFHLYAYNRISNIPDGVTMKDANDIIPSSAIFKDSMNTYASFADWFRLKLLCLQGGWWVDMDTICCKPIDIPDPYCFSSEWSFDMLTTKINNTCIKSPPHAPYLRTLIADIEAKINGDQPIQWGEAGIYLFRKYFQDAPGLQQHIQPPLLFCPVNYFDLSGLICQNDYQPAPETYTIHLWNEIWRRGHLDKNACYHPDSIYEKLKRKYIY